MSRLSGRALIGALVAVVVVIGAIAGWWWTSTDAPSETPISSSFEPSDDAVSSLPPGVDYEGPLTLGLMSVGSASATVEVIEFASLTCPHCATFHKEVYPLLKRDYVETGKIRLEFREVYFDRLGLFAGMLARCGGEERYFGFISLLLERQDEWARIAEPADLFDVFSRYGRQAGLSDERVRACLTDEAGQRALVEQYREYYEDPRLTGTPTLVVDGEKVQDWSYESLSAAIDKALGAS